VLDLEVHPDEITTVKSYHIRTNRVLNVLLNPNHVTRLSSSASAGYREFLAFSINLGVGLSIFFYIRFFYHFDCVPSPIWKYVCYSFLINVSACAVHSYLN